jgi:hypothetical protein
MAAVLIIVIGIFAIGMVAGVIVVVSIGVKREDQRFLQVAATDNVTRGARRLTGLYVKDDVYSRNIYEDLLV